MGLLQLFIPSVCFWNTEEKKTKMSNIMHSGFQTSAQLFPLSCALDNSKSKDLFLMVRVISDQVEDGCPFLSLPSTSNTPQLYRKDSNMHGYFCYFIVL
jgi:hypothetical protein